LIVDDEPLVCGLVRDELSASGCVCSATTDLPAAKEYLRQIRFDVLLTDFLMPQGNGLQLLACAKHSAPDCKVILMTGKGNREILAQAVFLGAFDYIEKPFAPGVLAATVAKAAGTNGSSELSLRAATAIERCAHAGTISLESVFALARAVEAKDAYTRRHSEQVAHYATSFAVALGLPGVHVESIRIAALLHDIGKIGVPDHILTKAGPLTEDEFAYVRRHPTLGADIVSKIRVFHAEAQLVRHHHERWDGRGYPDGLAGEESPVGARIIQVSDCIDAMLMERPYKRKYPVEKMLDELVRCAGTQFDPGITAVAVEWCRVHPSRLILPGRNADTPTQLLAADLLSSPGEGQ